MKQASGIRNHASRSLRIAIALLASALCAPNAARAQSPSVIPLPLSATPAAGTLQVKDGAAIVYPEGDTAARFAAEHLVDLLQHTRGLHLVTKPVRAGAPSHALITITRAASAAPKESYDLAVTTASITISAADDAGIYYGTISLWQLLTATDARGPAELQCVSIHDAPQMQWRGIMLDSARHMQSIQFIQQLIDWMSLEKLNVLHWHLTDDQGWRLEIKQYPRLTSVGAWRELTSTSPTMDEATRKSHHYGGYYSQDEVRKLVAYAAQRNVMIVPEIEMPGHASAPLAAYPEFGSSDAHLKASVSEYGIFPTLYNVNDATFTFIENILTEVMQLFPSPYIHVGGDEAIKDQWKASPQIQAQMKQLGIHNEDELQSYFIKRIDTFLTAHHRRTLGWDEILQGGLAQNAAVMSWHGVQGGIDAARQGHDAVLTPTRPLYFNYRQSDAADEAPGRWAINTLSNVYAFNPTPDALTVDERKHILGVQANLWTEYIITADRAQWMLFPRAAALAEIAWSTPARRSWNDFQTRLPAEMHRYRALGINFDPAAFRVRSAEKLEPDHTHVTVHLSNQTSFGTLRYTTNGSPVTASSAQYDGPLTLSLPTHLRAAAFLQTPIPGSELDRPLNALSVSRRYSQEMNLCVNEAFIAMEPDPIQPGRPVVMTNYKNPCWIYKAADLTGVKAISAGVVSLAYVFRDRNTAPPPLGKSHTAHGEIEVHMDTCTGKLVATLPLPTANHAGVTSLQTPLQNLQGIHDLCLKVVRPTVNPLWVIDWAQLDPATESR
ncbi:MAG TPA: family 20 glycosylhydrolase [Acidobacteriaceae bacterium]